MARQDRLLSKMSAIVLVTTVASSMWLWAKEEVAKRPTAGPVPFRLAHPNKPLIILETTVEAQGPFRFVLDTGASLTIISPELAETLDITLEQPQAGLGAGGGVEVRIGTVRSVSIGETRQENVRVGVMDLKGIAAAVGSEIDGIIGYNFLSNYRVTIDYPRLEVSFE
jgi:predicted aspartyl protease